MSVHGLQRGAGWTLAAVAALLIADSAFLVVARTVDPVVVAAQRAHLVLGVGLTVLLGAFVSSHVFLHRDHSNRRARAVGLWVASGAGLGCVAGGALWWLGKSGATRWLVLLHEAAFVGTLAAYLLHRLRARVSPALRPERLAAVAVLLLVAGIQVAQLVLPADPPAPVARAFDPGLSRAATVDGHQLRAEDLRDTTYCAGCHEEIAARWEQSAHRFSSLNNPFYLATVRNLQESRGTEAASFCGACHDPVLLFGGTLNQRLSADTPDGDQGITCLVCHGIAETPDPIGNGGYTLRAPDHYPGYGSEDPEAQELNARLIRSKPAQHVASFAPGWLRSPALCGGCHKAHLPEELTGARWHRGQNEMDPWHDSGAGGFGARTFFPPGTPSRRCQDCHMPMIDADDPAATDGKVADHAFPGANTSLAATVGEPAWLARSQAMFEGVVSVDLAAVQSPNGRTLAPDGPVDVTSDGRVEIDVVVRNRKSGHLFPGGIADLREAWLEITVTDGAGIVRSASGWLDPGGHVDPAAHRWQVVLLDREGAPLRVHDVEDTWAVLTARRIVIGASDVVRVAFTAPTSGELTARARVLHRKFPRDYVEFALGPAAPAQPLDVLASASLSLVVGDGAPRAPSAEAGARLRDLGIGHLLRGDTGAAREAALLAAERMPADPGPHLDLARGALSSGDLAGAEAAVRAADALAPGHPTAAWLLASVRLGQGRFDQGLAAIDVAIAAFPRDRELHVLRGRLLRELDRSEEAALALERALAIDPEHVGAHAQLGALLAERGDDARAAPHLAAAERMRPDSAEQVVTERARRADPHLDLRANPDYVLELGAPPPEWAPGDR